MTAHHRSVILQSTKDVQFQSTWNLCRESHKTQVWLCFLVLSFLSTSMCAAPGRTIYLQSCINTKELKDAIERSDAMLYAPSSNDVEEKCKKMVLRCYMLELMMVMIEEDIKDPKIDCILHFSEFLHEAKYVGCPPCEAYSLKNITVFLERLNNLLQEMNSRDT